VAAALDPSSITRLSAAGVPVVGQRCLTLAAGASRVPGWLADRVGPAGVVLATDTDPDRLVPHPRVNRLHHDWQRPPAGGFGLIWTRLGLAGQRHPDRLLHTLAGAVTTAGMLVVEEWYGPHQALVLAAPTPRDRRLTITYLALMAEQVLPTTGFDGTWAARIHTEMAAAGLNPVDTRIHTPVWAAGSPAGLATAAQLHHYRPHLLTAGMSVGEVRRLTELLTNPNSGLVVAGQTLFSVIGRKPAPRRPTRAAVPASPHNPEMEP
jgi:hypothetical protein